MGVQRHHRVQQMPGLGYREGRAQSSRLLAEDLALDAAHELDVLLHEGLGSHGAWQRPWRWLAARVHKKKTKAGVAMARARDPWRRRCSWSITAPSSVLTA